MLRVTLVGHLGADAELRQSQKGMPIVSFRVAVNLLRPGLNEERQESTEWFRVRVMGRQSEYAQRLAKGTRVLVVGRLDISHYQSHEGEPRIGFDVWADEIQNLSPRPDTDDNTSAREDQRSQPRANTQQTASARGGSQALDPRTRAPQADPDDLPF